MKKMHATSYLITTIVVFLFLSISLIHAKKVLVTGGAGFIGSHVVQGLLKRGDDVVVVDNINDGYPQFIKRHNLSLVSKTYRKSKLTIYEVDVCDQEAMNEVCAQEQPDCICHLAARAGVRQSINDPQEYCSNNIGGTVVVLEMARKHGINYVVCASSSSVYGVRENGPFYETDPDDKQSSPYGMTKRAGELLSYVYHHLFKISVTNLRFFTVYGPRGRIDMAPFIFIDAIDRNIPITVFGDGNAIRDFTYIDDIVDGIIKAIDTPLGYEIINLGRGEPIVLNDFIKIIENITHQTANVEYVANFSGDVPQTHADVQKAQQLLGYAPQTSLASGLQKMYEWYKNEYLLMDPGKRSVSFHAYVFDW